MTTQIHDRCPECGVIWEKENDDGIRYGCGSRMCWLSGMMTTTVVCDYRVAANRIAELEAVLRKLLGWAEEAEEQMESEWGVECSPLPTEIVEARAALKEKK